MSKEELDAMEVVDDFLCNQSVEALEKAIQKEISWDEFYFWHNSFRVYSEKYWEIKESTRRART
jgi:hypothetical protein